MSPWREGGRRAALLLLGLLAVAGPLRADTLEIGFADGARIAILPAPEGTEWCILWNHSVQGFPVEDCYGNRGGAMVLLRSHQPDFAAGLGHIPGRGRQVSDGRGGYFIEQIDEPVPGNAYVLRPGQARVDHRLRIGGTEIALSAIAPRQRIRIALRRDVGEISTGRAHGDGADGSATAGTGEDR